MPHWRSMLMAVHIDPDSVVRRCVWKSPLAKSLQLVIQKGNRKTPGFNPDPEVQIAIHDWIIMHINTLKPDMIICMDLAMLGQVERAWDSATIDNCRGGLYNYFGRPFYIMTPISAINLKKSSKDIAIMNKGVYSKDEWDERFNQLEDDEEGTDGDDESDSDNDESPEEIFIEPYFIELGRWIVHRDLVKLARIIQRINVDGFVEYRPQIRIVQSVDEAREAEAWLLGSILISNDIETDPKAGLITVNGFTGLHNDGKKRTFVFPFYIDRNWRLGTHPALGEFLDVIAKVNMSGIPFTYQNAGYDLFWLLFYGLPVKNYAYDSMTMFWSLWPELPKRLDFISSILLGDYRYWKGARKSDDFYTYLVYNGLDCDRTMDDTIFLINLLQESKRGLQNFWHAHMRVLMFLGLSVKGVKADEEVRARHSKTLDAKALDELEKLRYLVADPKFNPNSVPQKKDLLYTKLGVKKRTKKGKFTNNPKLASTGAVALRSMRNEHPIFRRIVQAIMDTLVPSKQISNVIGLSRAAWTATNIRFHTGYNGVGTGTTRASSNKSPINISGNLQNIRKDYRDIIRADEGFFFLDIDFSAADDVFVSFESGDPRKIELFRSGRDSHAANATLFFTNWTYEQVVAGKKAKDTDPELYARVTHPITGIRQITKKITHGANYLMAGNTLLQTAGREAIVAAAKELGHRDAGFWTQDRLVDFCIYLEGLYRAHYIRFKRSGSGSWYMELKDEFARTGGFTSAFNYFQRFLGDRNDESVLRAIAASAGQANTAGRINAAMEELVLGRISPRFRDAANPAFGTKPLRISRREHGINLQLQNHDSFTFGVLSSHSNWQEGVDRILRVMERPVLIRNKLTGRIEEFVIGREAEVGIHWGNGLKEVKGNSVAAIEKAVKELGLS